MKSLSLMATCVIVILIGMPLNAQDVEQDTKNDRIYDPVIHDKPYYWGDEEDHLDAQARRMLHLVDITFQTNPPTIEESDDRKLALYLMDAVLHYPDALNYVAVHEFLDLRIDRVSRQIENTIVANGAMVWKLYNEGYVVRTSSVTIGFDIIQQVGEISIDRQSISRIIDECDVLFISHRHKDHADLWVAEEFIRQGKPVVAPEQIWVGDPIHNNIIHMPRQIHILDTLRLSKNKEELKVATYPGHQGAKVENNVPIVITPEGISVCHTGDQKYSDDFVWIDEIHKHHPVDILLPNCWTLDMPRMVRGIKPSIIIPGHENEMNHTVDHREPNWLTYERTRNVSAPVIIMAWGESYHYVPEP